MENHNVHFFRVTFMLDLFVLLFFSTEVVSAPVTIPSITEVMRNDTKLCNTSKFLYDNTEFAKPCALLPYPVEPWNSLKDDALEQYLCLGIYDTAYKICQYSSHPQHQFNSTAILTRYAQKIASTKGEIHGYKFCEGLKSFKSIYKKIDSLWMPLVEYLRKTNKCQRICFNLHDELHPVCAVLDWIKNIDDIPEMMNKTEIAHDTISSNIASHAHQADDKVTSDARNLGNKDENKSQARKTNEEVVQISSSSVKNDNSNKKEKSSMPSNVVQTGNMKSDMQEVNIDTDKLNGNKTQKKENVTKSETNTIVTKPINNVSANGPQTSAVNDPGGNMPKKVVNENGNIEKLNKEQDADHLKSTTLSENTQDYDVGNSEDEMGSNIGDNTDDIDDTVQQPIETGNQNENLHEASEQKDNLQYPNIRVEDDSHFFVYFTVITVGCIAGYVGYHNKQKILAIVLEGRRSRNNRGRRRPSTASYRKLDCTLEEAVTSQCNANVTHVIY